MAGKKTGKRLLTWVLVLVMALSLLTGCALGDAAKENAMLKALQTVGDLYQVKVSESDSLSKKASGIFKAFKNAKGKAWDIDELRKTEGSSDISTSVTYKETDYRVIVLKMPQNAKDSTKWGYPADAILYSYSLNRCIEKDEDGNDTLKVGFDVMNDTKLTDTQEKAEDYMVVFAKLPEAQDGGDITIWA